MCIVLHIDIQYFLHHLGADWLIVKFSISLSPCSVNYEERGISLRHNYKFVYFSF